MDFWMYKFCSQFENCRVAIEVIKVANIIQALSANAFASEYVLLHSHITSCSHITLTYHTTLHWKVAQM